MTIAWFGAGRLGDPDQCEGIGWGCTPDQLFTTVGVVFESWLFLLLAAVAARLARQHRFRVLAVGMALAGLGTFAVWNAHAVTFPVPGLTVQQGRTQAEAVLTRLRSAVGRGNPALPADGAHVDVPPTLADVLASMPTSAPTPCRDAKERNIGSSSFEWSHSVKVYVPMSGQPVVTAPEQVERAIEAVRASGYTVDRSRRRQGERMSTAAFTATRAGPPPARRGDAPWLLSMDFRVDLSATAERTSEPALAVVRVKASIRTPCLR